MSTAPTTRAAGEQLYPHVFSPFDIAGVTIPNRIVRTAHGTRLTRGGRITEDLIAYHEAAAAADVGMTVLEIASVHPSGNSPGITIWDDEVLEGYERLMQRLRRYPMKVFQQLMHFGQVSVRPNAQPPWAPSPLPSLRSDDAIQPTAMTKAQIDTLVEAYARAAGRVVAGGLDGVEIHAGHGLLLGQFLSPLTNLREDEYGGSFENRARLTREILAAIRAEVKGAIPVGMRISADEYAPGGVGVEESKRLVAELEADGALDFIDLSVASSFSFHRVIGGMDERHGYQLPAAVPVARATALPSIVAGRITSLEHAEQIVAAGDADMVAMVRATIADPEIVAKSRRGEAHRVRPCIGCNQGCVGGNAVIGGRLGCAVNPDIGADPADTVLKPAAPARRVLVVGGGPAGMEAARVAAERGHEVVLCERGERLGGQLNHARMLPYRSDIGEITDWLARELELLGVEVRLSTEVTPQLVRELRAERVIVATGATPRRDGLQTILPRSLPLPGVELPHVITSWEAIESPPAVRRVVVLDDVGHYEGAGVAETLLDAGAEVTFVTRLSRLAPLMDPPRTTGALKSRFSGRPLHVLPEAQIERIDSESVVVRSIWGGETQRVAAEAVVTVLVNEPQRALADQLSDVVDDVRLIGDALSPRFLPIAIAEGHSAGAAI